MANHDGLVQVTVTGDAPPVTQQGFGDLLIVGQATFGERTRSYANPAAVTADAAVLSAELQAALNDALAQNPRPPLIKAGRRDDMQVTFTIGVGVADGDTFDIAIAGLLESYVATVPADDEDAVAAALRGQLTGVLPAGFTVSGASNVVIVTNDVGDSFAFSSLYTDNGGTSSITEAIIVGDIFAELDLIRDEDSIFYGLALTSHADQDNLRASDWVELNRRLFIGQTLDPVALTVSSTDVGAVCRDAGKTRTAFSWYSDDAEHITSEWQSNKLANDLDAPPITSWSHIPLVGPAVDDLNITDAEKVNLDAKFYSTYLTFKGLSTMNDGRLCSGKFIDELTTSDWVVARSEEDFAQALVNASVAGSRIPYTDIGIEAARSVVGAVLKRGENIGHFVPGLTFATSPRLVNVPLADRQAGRVRIAFTATLQSAIHSAVITGFVTIAIL